MVLPGLENNCKLLLTYTVIRLDILWGVVLQAADLVKGIRVLQ